jgi:hypothetical protein
MDIQSIELLFIRTANCGPHRHVDRFGITPADQASQYRPEVCKNDE